jgi:hypothetical protein
MWTKLSGLSFAIVLAAFGIGCDDTTPSTMDMAVDNSVPAKKTFAGDVAPILMMYGCKGCHSPSDAGPARGMLDLTTGKAALVGVPAPQCTNLKLVAAGDPNNSYLIAKLNGKQAMVCTSPAASGTGKRMPFNGDQAGKSYLTDDQIATISQWITDGAN